MKRVALYLSVLLIPMAGFADLTGENAHSEMPVSGTGTGTDSGTPMNSGATTHTHSGIDIGSSILDVGGFTQIQQVPPVTGSTQTITTIVDGDLRGKQEGEVESTQIQTQTIAPSTNPMPLWEQALQPEATTTVSIQDIEKYSSHTEVTSVQQQTTAPSTSEVPPWKQVLEPPAITKTITTEKEVVTPTGDDITTIQSQTVGPLPVWDNMPRPDAGTSLSDSAVLRNDAGAIVDETVVQSQLKSPVESGPKSAQSRER